MGTLRSIYVSVQDEHLPEARIREHLPPATEIYTEADNPFVEILWDDFRAPTDLLETLSRDFRRDVLWLVFQSVVDAFAFEHWRDGQCSRSIVFGCFHNERCLEKIDGDPESWEDGVFDSMAVGEFGEAIDGRETARAVAEFYKLPGWA